MSVNLTSCPVSPFSYKIAPLYMKENDYVTHAIGKWDVGHYSTLMIPTSRGFDTFLGYYGSAIEYYTHAVRQDQICTTDECQEWLDLCDGHHLYDFHYNSGHNTGDEYDANYESGNYSTYVFENRVEKILEDHVTRNSSKKLFIYLAHQAPHSPHDAPNSTTQYFEEQFLTPSTSEESGWAERAQFAACLHELDNAVEGLVRKLEVLDLYSNSFIFFFSDNGAALGKTGGGSNWPLRGGKFLPYEGGVRVPAFIHSPLLPGSRIGQTVEALIQITDVMPTVLELAGVETRHLGLDGVSALPPIWNGLAGNRDSLLVHADVANTMERSQWYGAYIYKNWKLIVNATPAGWYSPDSLEYATSESCYNVPSHYTSLALAENGSFPTYFNETMLFDLSVDPTERDDIKKSYPALAEHLMTKFMSEIATAVDAQYDCGCNCLSEGCSSVYKWFFQHSCFVYPWSESMEPVPMTPKDASPTVPEVTDPRTPPTPEAQGTDVPQTGWHVTSTD